ncbi:hypothetical protein CYMTET_52820 [Cymbomonas tetramitiformis]|uniref:Uncharacterized protein n=1 Tax=Cymbomonas tetramitiformis TaxID=36881 RepID=A0AAE0EQP0_9CHLO|nr:hypothetical protein CYMTET_52820 [Cymbomonas tetramitiformis]
MYFADSENPDDDAEDPADDAEDPDDDDDDNDDEEQEEENKEFKKFEKPEESEESEPEDPSDEEDATLPVRAEANGLSFSALANLVNPESPAGDWLESSGAHFPDDGKRALLEVVRRLYDNGPPMTSAKQLLSIEFKAGEDPGENITAFNSALRESGRKTRWDTGEVKDLFLAALDKEYYLPVLNEFINYEQRQAVDLLTLQQRVMAVHSAKGATSPPVALSYSGHSSDVESRMSDVLDALDALRKEVRQLKQGRGYTPRHPKCRHAAERQYRADCPNRQQESMHHVELHEDALADLFQHAYDTRDAQAFHSLCIAHGKPPVVDGGDAGGNPEDVFLDYDEGVCAGDVEATAEIHAGSFVPAAAITESFTAAAATIDKNIYPVTATQQVSAGPPLPPTSRLFADLVLAGSGEGGAFVGAPTNMGHFATENISAAEILPDDDEEDSIPLVELPTAPAIAEPAVTTSAPHISFSRCGVGAAPFGKGMFFSAALLCTILFSAANIPTAAAVPAGIAPRHQPTFLTSNIFAPTAFARHTACGGVDDFSITNMFHGQFACASACPSTPSVVFRPGRHRRATAVATAPWWCFMDFPLLVLLLLDPGIGCYLVSGLLGKSEAAVVNPQQIDATKEVAQLPEAAGRCAGLGLRAERALRGKGQLIRGGAARAEAEALGRADAPASGFGPSER